MNRFNCSRLALESFEARNLMSASPLPVLMVIADQQDFFYREYGDTRNSLLQSGVSAVVAATTTNPSIPHPNSGQGTTTGVITPNIALSAVDPDNYSAIVFVGGWGSSMYQYAFNDPNLDGSTDNYYFNGFYNGDANLNDGKIAPQKVVVNTLINQFLAQDKPVAGICHGTTVLAWARVNGVSPVAGKNIVVPHTDGTPAMHFNGFDYPAGFAQGQFAMATHNGAIVSPIGGTIGNPATAADDVVVDGRIITAENDKSASLFGTVIAQEVIENANRPIQVAAVSINDGAVQRSRVTSISVTFNHVPTLPAVAPSPFRLVRQSDSATIALASELNNNTVRLTFTGGAVDGNSLADGRYTLSILGTVLTTIDGNGDGTVGDSYVLVGNPATNGLFRLFGDANGDGDVDNGDFIAFRTAFGNGPSIFDADGDGDTDNADFGTFRTRFGAGI